MKSFIFIWGEQLLNLACTLMSVRNNIEVYLAKIEQAKQKNFISGIAYYGHGTDSNVYNNTFLDTTPYGSLQLQNNTKETKAVFNRFIFALEQDFKIKFCIRVCEK